MPHLLRVTFLVVFCGAAVGAAAQTTLPTPDARTVEVSGQLRIAGGNPGAGKVLTSDAKGLGSWQAPVTATLVCPAHLPKRAAGQVLLPLPAEVRPETVVGITAVVPLAGGELVPPGYTAESDRYYSVRIVAGAVQLTTSNNSGAVLDQEVRVLLTYQP